MPILMVFQGPALMVRLAGLVVAGTVLAAAPGRAEVVPVADMARGIRMTSAQCTAIPSAVWVSALGRTFCMRYFLSTAGGEGLRPAVFLQGDRLGRLDLRTGVWTLPADARDINTDDLVRFA